ncbi:shikimate dehydrogenase [Methylobacillus sp. Pita1]|uniref:shikimate dehydrogenase n=1 Tax=Methylobacillus sp. Pita1 TaxID=3382642 RepID=UPI0038B63711
MDRYAVIGHPVEHSKSPLIHVAFAQQTGQQIEYGKVQAPLDGFVATVAGLQAQGYCGANVTVPFKFEAYSLATELSERARDAGAVNTLSFKNGGIHGDNTDGAGLVRDILQNLEFSLAGKRVLLLGAGGAAEGVLGPLLQASPALLCIANRSVEKAEAMAARARPVDAELDACSFDALAGKAFDVVINATSSGLSNERLPLPSGLFAADALAYDMMYGRETPFMQYAREEGVQKIADGLGMLVEQAAEAFYVWRQIRPDTASVIAALRTS